MSERSGVGAVTIIDAGRVAELIPRERPAHCERHPRLRQAFAAGANLPGGVRMTWMRMWPGGVPLYLAGAHGARLTDIDGNAGPEVTRGRLVRAAEPISGVLQPLPRHIVCVLGAGPPEDLDDARRWPGPRECSGPVA